MFFSHGSEDDMSALMISFKIRGKDEGVIYIHDHPSFINLILKDMIYICLEGGRGVTETEKHDNGFIEIRLGDKSCFPSIIRVNKDIIVSPLYIDLSEVLGRAEFIEKWWN